MTVKFAVASDLHWDADTRPFSGMLLRRVTAYLAIRGDVDLLVLAGDLAETPDLLPDLKKIADTAPCPVIAIPGNHDAPPEEFHRVFPRVDHLDLGGVRFIPFEDPERPGWNAERMPDEISRGERRGAEFPGPKVWLQHVPLQPPDESCGFGYTNAAKLIESMKRSGAVAAIGGHYHLGTPTVRRGPFSFANIPALGDSPFAMTIFTLERGVLREERVTFRLPGGIGDNHTHSPLAYCNQNMGPEAETRLLELLNLRHIVKTEHSGHLLYSCPDYSAGKWFFQSAPRADRTGDYARLLGRYRESDGRFMPGVELDIDAHGEIVTNPTLEKIGAFRVGAIHKLTDPKSPDAFDEYMRLAEKLICHGRIQVLAHPFRVFAWGGNPDKPIRYFDTLVKMLRDHNVAAEVNFHANRPDPVFTGKCLNAGVKLSFGGDVHNLYELGFFNPHLDFVRSLGYNGDLRDILLQP